MKFVVYSSLIAFLLVTPSGYAQTGNSPVGLWKGTSTCQVKDSPFNNEIVVCYITEGETPNSFELKMNKVVNGVEEEMGGALNVQYNVSAETLSCSITDRRQREDIWTFQIKGQEIEGTLTVDKVLYRIIKLKKTNTIPPAK